MPTTSESRSIWNINIQTEDGLKELEFYLQNGANPDELGYVPCPEGSPVFEGTLLIEAAFWENVRAVEILVKFGAETNCSHPSRGTPLIIAAGIGNQEICELLISHGADVNFLWAEPYISAIQQTYYVRGSALHRAAENGQTDIIRLLVEHGANPDVVVDSIPLIGTVDTAIAAAAREGHYAAVEALIEGRADVDFMYSIGFSALHEAVRSNSLDIVQLLVENGANVNQRGSLFGVTPLYLARDVRSRFPNQTNVDIQHYLTEHGGIAHIKWWYYPLIMMGFEFYCY